MFSQFYQHHFELISKYMYNFGFKIRLQGGLSELEFNGDLVYMFKTIVCKTVFFRTNLKNCHSLQKDQYGYPAANWMHCCQTNYGCFLFFNFLDIESVRRRNDGFLFNLARKLAPDYQYLCFLFSDFRSQTSYLLCFTVFALSKCI